MQLGRFWSRRSFASPRPTSRTAAALAVATVAALAAGCFTEDTGIPPPLEGKGATSFYFPTGLAVSPGATTLYVTNSDFDLQFNGGTVVSLDLAGFRDKLRSLLSALNDKQMSVAAGCKQLFGGAPNDNAILYPGPCKPIPLAPLIKRSVIIGAFASGAELVMRPDNPATPDNEAGARLFVTVRGDPSLTFFDVADDRAQAWTCPNSAVTDAASCLECPRASDDPDRCGSQNRVGLSPFDNTRGVSLPVEPQGIAASEDGTAIVVAHQTEAAVSLSINRWPGSTGAFSRPTLEYVATGLPDGPSEVATVPIPRLITAMRERESEPGSPVVSYEPGFLVSYRGAPQIDLFRFHTDIGGTESLRPFLSRVASAGITVNADGKDSRGLAIDASARQACEAACPAGDPGADDPAYLTCLQGCADIPLRLFVVNRSPASLLIGKIETTLAEDSEGKVSGAFDKMSIQSTVPLAFGPSKVVVGRVIGLDGAFHVRAFVAAFDSRMVFSYDPEARRIDAVFRTGRGPHALAVDARPDTTPGANDGYALLYVGHFTDSYMGVVDLDMRHLTTFGTMVASLGTPLPPRETK